MKRRAAPQGMAPREAKPDDPAGAEKMTHPHDVILEALNKFLSMGFALREATKLTDAGLKLQPGTARSVLVGGAR
jgi:hypothetical protein